MKNKKLSFKEAQLIAKDSAVKKLQEMNISRESLEGFMVNYVESNNQMKMELYKPGVRPIDAEVLLTVIVDKTDGTVTFE